jgi:hypothetical protein
MKLTIGAFHAGASRLSTLSTRLTPRASSAARRVAVCFLSDGICRLIISRRFFGALPAVLVR